MTPRVGILVLSVALIRFIVKIHYFFKNSLLPSTDQSNWGYSNDVWGRVNQNYKFHEPEGMDSCAGAWSFSERATLLLFILSILGHESDKLSIKQWEQGNTQVPVKALGPLVQTKYHAVFQWDLTTTFKGNCIIIHVALLVNVSRVSDVAHGPLVKFQYCTCTFKQTSFFAKITRRVNQGKLINMKCC